MNNSNRPGPEWHEAPSWANYLVFDADGQPYWFENRPTATAYSWKENGGRKQFATLKGWSYFVENRPEIIETPEDEKIENYANFTKKSAKEAFSDIKEKFGSAFDEITNVDQLS